ncbi:DNA-J related domain-containing protein [Shewanella decolorationis]|uniref:Heat shock protein DnaJ domain-containing protein n=1 Tax=Shewanella decolorationis S12 TaxID=1353536 RepID=A0ABN0PHC8_9GAMM|nr:DNA-J related domain-containing protein [Shewanella decolorationis]ESE39304.1 heat shock protein DnaJ domain-containing protein [Shewanella decolorationis S12]GLR33401.1 molecular chaperone DnaJ [Shewanella decolorationis]
MLLAKPSLSAEAQSAKVSTTKGDNPLIWPVLSVLQASNQSWKIHHLATELQNRGLIHQLDENPGNDLFKRNFLLMNALFELQGILLPKQWLQVKAMEIQIFRLVPSNVNLLIMEDTSLREYYLDWNNYDTSENVVRELLEAFWSSYKSYIGLNVNLMHKGHALRVFELDESATPRDIRKQWRRLALKWHPDRPEGDAARFREVCEAWQSLRDIA